MMGRKCSSLLLLLWCEHSPQAHLWGAVHLGRSSSGGWGGQGDATVADMALSSSGMKNQGQRGLSYPPQPRAGLTLRPLGGGPAMQPHHHGGKGHFALHTVLPDGIDDSSWEVDVEVTEEDDAVRVLGTDRGGSVDPMDQGSEVRPLPRTIFPFLPI